MVPHVPIERVFTMSLKVTSAHQRSLGTWLLSRDYHQKWFPKV